MASVPLDDLPNNLVPENDLPEEIVSAINKPMSVSEQLAAPKSAWETFTTPIEPQEFSGKDVLTEGAIGAGIGAALGSPTLIGAPAGALTGGILGLTSGMAGEVSRAMGNTPATTLGLEALFGLGTQGIGLAAKEATKLLPWKGRVLSAMLPGNLEKNASKIVGERMFGKDTYGLLHTTENSEATQTALKNQIFGNDIDLLTSNVDKKASDILREGYYNTLKELKDTTITTTEQIPATFSRFYNKEVTKPSIKVTKLPNVFSTSPEYKLLLDDVDTIAQRTNMSSGEIRDMQQILRNELSKKPAIAETSQSDVLNLLQNGGVYTVAKKGGEAETKTKIPEEARKALVKRFDQYLERNVGEKQYSILKNAERQEFIAEARDAIPTLLDEGFRLGSPEFTKAISLIEQSPTGKQDVINAFNQHIKNLENPEDMKRAFVSIAPKLRALKIIDRKGTSDISQKIRATQKGTSDLVKAQTLKNILIFPTISTTTSEVIGNDRLNPFKVLAL